MSTRPSLEAEQMGLQTKLSDLANAAEPANRMANAARQFVDGWCDVGELLSSAEPAEQNEIIRCFVAALELRFHDKAPKRADYTLHLYPELGDLNEGQQASDPKGPEIPGPITTKAKKHRQGHKTPQKTKSKGLLNGAPLTTDAKLRRVVEKAPPAGLEPATRRLTAACSTN